MRRTQQLPLPQVEFTRRYGLMAESLVVETNDEVILAAADASFGRFDLPGAAAQPLVLRVFRDPGSSGAKGGIAARVSHYFDGHRYLVGGSGDGAVVDAAAGLGVGFLADPGADIRHLRYSFLEGMALSMLTYGRGYFPLHASGVASNGTGVALVGPEGAGKSTLAVAAARRGLDVFAEDAVFVRSAIDGLQFWGVPWTQRLVLDARRFFPEFERIDTTVQPNGELKVELDLDEHFPGRATPNVRPAAVVVLDRSQDAPTRLEMVSGNHAQLEILWPWGDHWTADHAAAASLLSEVPVYRLAINGTPDEAIDHLESLLSDSQVRRQG